MRYKTSETTNILGDLPTGATVTVKIIDIVNDTELTLTSNSCVELQNAPGTYKFDTINIENPSKEMLYIMSDGSKSFKGKFIMGGYIDKVSTKNDVIMGSQL